MSDAWDPRQYDKFKSQRQEPFHDLMALVDGRHLATAVDLGCGTGELTALLARELKIGVTLGIDQSQAMLTQAGKIEQAGLAFRHGRIEDWSEPAGVDLIFSNAALQWLPDHRTLFSKLKASLRPGGQLAVQMPANHDHRSHLIAAAIAAEPPFAEALGGYRRSISVLPVEDYATLLHQLGFPEIKAMLKVYGHPLPSPTDVVEWVKGTLLTDYQARLSPELFARYLERYSETLVKELGDGPYFYAFKRLLLWARR